jgi:hypothetical protein
VSYDLFFRGRGPDRCLSWDEFKAYFSIRPNFNVQETQAWYSNNDTDVYFSFDYSERGDSGEAEVDEVSSTIPVSFNVNYYRPHPFGLEAELEVGAFVRHFDLMVSDPQTSGMGEGEYSRDGFLSGWNAGNEFAYRAIASQNQSKASLTLPASKLRAYWHWNFQRAERQVNLGDSMFVPKILFIDVTGETRTAAAWGDGIPVLLPSVDLVLVPRRELAPAKQPESIQDVVLFTRVELAPILGRFREVSGEIPCHELSYDETPAEIERAIRAKQPMSDKLKGVPFGEILDQELMEKALTSGGKIVERER